MARLEKEPLLEMFNHRGWRQYLVYLADLREQVRNRYKTTKTMEDIARLQGQEAQAEHLLLFREMVKELLESQDLTEEEKKSPYLEI